jgi:hypothetical protein
MMSATSPDEPGFETDVNELPEGGNRSEQSLEDAPPAGDEAPAALEDAQAEGAEERKEGGYH